MAAYTTLFACTLPLGSTDNARTALDLYLVFADELRAEDEPIAFEVRLDPESDGAELTLSSGAGSGDPDQVMAFVRRCGPALDLSGRLGVHLGGDGRPELPGRLRRRRRGPGPGERQVVASLDCDLWLVDTLGSQPVLPHTAS